MGNGHLGDQHRIVAKGRDNRLVDGVAVARDFLAKVTHAENTIEAPCVARIESAQGFRPIGEVADAAAELASFGRILVEKLRGAFVLAHLHGAGSGKYLSVIGRPVRVFAQAAARWLRHSYACRCPPNGSGEPDGDSRS